jgi:hypothetical protein
MLEGLTPPKNRAVYCRIDQLLAEMSAEDKQILIDALDSPSWSANALSTALRQRGVSVADTTITKHRNKTCACYRG